MDIEAFKRLTRRVLEVTDELGIHREAVTIPLDRRTEGELRMIAPDKLEVAGPESDDIEPFIESLPEMIRGLDTSTLPRADEIDTDEE